MWVVHITGGIPERIRGHIYDRVGEMVAFRDIPDNFHHAARSNSCGSRWYVGRPRLGTYWNRLTSHEEFEDVCSTVEEPGAMVWMDVVMQSRWPGCREILGFYGEFWGQCEPEETHKLVLNRPRIGTGRLPPTLCRPGKEKHRWAWPCFTLWQTCLSGEFRRHRTDCSRFWLECAILLGWVDWFGREHRL